LGRWDQAVRDVREVPRIVEKRLVDSFRDGSFQARWNTIVSEAEELGETGTEALGIAARELSIDFIETLRSVLMEREKATFARSRK
jgi:hypothetical protein